LAQLGDALRAFERAFRTLDARWFVFGAQAAIFYGVARATADVDVTVEPGGRTTRELADALVDAGFSLRFPDEDFVARTRVLPVKHASGMPADVVLGDSPIEALFFDRVERHRIDGANVPVAAVEDIVVMKVLAGREKDRSDIVPMLRSRRAKVDLDQIRSTLGLLEQTLDQSDLLPEFERLLKVARR